MNIELVGTSQRVSLDVEPKIISPIDLLKVKSNNQYYVKSNTLNLDEHYYVNKWTQKRCVSKLTNLYDFIV